MINLIDNLGVLIPSIFSKIVIIAIIFILICYAITFPIIISKMPHKKRKINIEFEKLDWNYTDALIYDIAYAAPTIYNNIDNSCSGGIWNFLIRFQDYENETTERPSKIPKSLHLIFKKSKKQMIGKTVKIRYKKIFYDERNVYLIELLIDKNFKRGENQ